MQGFFFNGHSWASYSECLLFPNISRNESSKDECTEGPFLLYWLILLSKTAICVLGRIPRTKALSSAVIKSDNTEHEVFRSALVMSYINCIFSVAGLCDFNVNITFLVQVVGTDCKSSSYQTWTCNENNVFKSAVTFPLSYRIWLFSIVCRVQVVTIIFSHWCHFFYKKVKSSHGFQ